MITAQQPALNLMPLPLSRSPGTVTPPQGRRRLGSLLPSLYAIRGWSAQSSDLCGTPRAQNGFRSSPPSNPSRTSQDTLAFRPITPQGLQAVGEMNPTSVMWHTRSARIRASRRSARSRAAYIPPTRGVSPRGDSPCRCHDSRPPPFSLRGFMIDFRPPFSFRSDVLLPEYSKA